MSHSKDSDLHRGDDNSKTPSSEQLCTICYETFDSQDIETGHQQHLHHRQRAVSTGCSLKHAYCRECLMDYCEHCILHGQIPIPCPGHASSRSSASPSSKNHPNNSNSSESSTHRTGCNEALTESLVMELLKPSQQLTSSSVLQQRQQARRIAKHKASASFLLRRYKSGLARARNPALIPCPRCEQLVDGNTSSDDESQQEGTPERTCQACDHTFCAVHGDAHAGMTCADWYAQTEQGQQVLATEQALRRSQHIRPCSHCGMALHKTAGCDHVVCTACQQDMCFHCGTHEYLTGKVIRHCTKCQQGYVDHRYARHYQLRTCLTLPLVLPAYILYIVIMAVVAIVTCGFCACFWCGTEMIVLDDDAAEKKKAKKRQPAKDALSGTTASTGPESISSSSAGGVKRRSPVKEDDTDSVIDRDNKKADEPDWSHGFRIGMAIVFLPLLMVIHDLFGTRFSALEELLTNNDNNNNENYHDYENNHHNMSTTHSARSSQRQPAPAALSSPSAAMEAEAVSVDDTARTTSFDLSV